MTGLQSLARKAADQGVRPTRRCDLRALMLGASSLLALPLAGEARAQTRAPALPQGGAFVAGSGAIATSGAATSITQTSARGVIDWRSFSIGAGGRVSIDNGVGATLNRVLGGELSRIDGRLTATGSVYLINPTGVVVGPGGKVLTGGGFIASTRDIADGDFMTGGPMTAFGRSSGDLVNAGSIVARDGDVVLIGRSVENTGAIAAAKGTATLAAADTVLLTTVGGPAGVYVAPDAGATGSVTHTGRIAAAAAALKAAGGDVYTLAGNRAGLISASGVRTVDGQVFLSAPGGEVVAGGTITARGVDGAGGSIVVNGARTEVAAGAVLDARGTRGGQVLVGVSSAGGGDLAASTTISEGATLLAGGPSGGGLVETSGHVVTIGAARIAAGVGGTWSVDPYDLTIDAPAAASIANALNAGTNVTEQTTGCCFSGAGSAVWGAGDIVVAAPIAWTGSGALTLDAFHDLRLNAAITGGGSLTGLANGAVAVNAAVSAGSVQLTANGGSLTLASGASVAGAAGVTLGTSGAFVNNVGASALSGGTGRWLVYSANPANDTTGGLSPAFYQYAAALGATPAQGGNGLLYSLAPSVSVTLSGSASKSYDGTTALTFTGANATVSGLVNGDAAAVTGVYASKNVGSGLQVTANGVAVSHGGAPVYGYAGLTPSVSATIGQITPATLVAAIVGTPTKTYNGTTTATLGSANYQFTGFATGEGATVNQPSSVAYASAAAGSQTINATFGATNFVAAGGTLLSNYVLPTTASGAGTILQAPLLVNGVLATDKTYDRSTADMLNTGAAALYGVIGADVVSLVTSGAAGTFASANAGSNLAVTASGFSLTGSAAANYALVQPGGLTASIGRAGLTVSGVSALGKTYDGTTTATLSLGGAALSGVITGDTVGLGAGGASGAFATADAGVGKAVTASGFTLTGAAASNYTLSQPAGLSADITKKTLSVAITATPTKVYDGTSTAVVGSSGFTLSGFVAGESGSVGQTSHVNYAAANAGTEAVTATLAVSDYLAGANTRLSNYILPTSATGVGAITAAPLTIQLVGDPTKTYDGTVAATLSGANFTLTGFLAGQGAAVTQTAGLYADKNVGVRLVTATLGAGDFTPLSGTQLSNYQLPTFATGYGTITPAALAGSISASITGNPTKSYDGSTVATLTSANFTLYGFASGEGATVTQTVGAYADKNAGVKPVTASLSTGDFSANVGTTLSNYTLPTIAYGSGTITPAVLTASVTGTPTKVYNATTVAVLDPSNLSFAGLASGESLSVSGAPNATYDSTQAGGRTVTATFAVTNLAPAAGTLLANYVLPTTATGAGLITQAPLSILNVAALSKTYDTTTAASLSTGGATLFGVVAGDTVGLSSGSATASFAGANAGSHVAVTASGFAISGGDSANYQLFQPTGLFANINRAPLTITGVAAVDKAYDATAAASLSTGGAALSGVLGPDSGAVGLDAGGAAGTFASVNVGANLAVSAGGFALTGAAATNYALVQPAGLHASITPAILTALVIGNPTKVYDGSTSVTLTGANYQLVGFVAGQGASVPQSATAHYVTADAGVRGISSSLVSSDFLANTGTNLANYQLPTTGTGTGTITQAALTVAIVGTPTKTYDATTAATLASVNYQLRGFVGAQSATVTQTSGTYALSDAGARAVSASLQTSDYTAGSGTDLGNYMLPTTAAGLGLINKALLSVTGVTATSRAYDGTYADALNVSGAGVSGLFGADTVTLNTGGASGLFASRDVGTGIGVAASGFSISGGRSANYTLAQPTGLSADITQATLTLSRVQRTYDAATDLPTSQTSYWLSGIVGGDSGAVVVDTSNLSGSYASKTVGSNTSVSVSGLALTGARAANYAIVSSVTNASIGFINPAPLTVTGVAVQTKTYDTTTTAALLNGGAALSGVLGADVVSLSNLPSTALFATRHAGASIAVTATGYTVAGGDAGNYTLSQPSGLTGAITKAAVSVASVSKTYDASTTITRTATSAVNASTFTLAGVLGSDVVSVATGVSGTYASKDVASGLGVSLSGLSLTGSSASDYQIASTQSGAIGAITPRGLSVSFAGSPTKVYDTTTAATLTPSNFVISGWATGEGGSITRTSGTYASPDAGSRGVSTTVAAGDYSPNAGTLLSNYTLATPTLNGTGLITPAPLTISGVLATSKTYDGTTADPLSLGGAALQGVLGSDGSALTLSTAGATGAFATAAVGMGKAVTATGFTVSGAKAANYTLSQPTGLSADIVQAMLQVASVTKIYNGTAAAYGSGVSYTLSGVVGGDSVALNTAGVTGAYAAKDVGMGLSVTLGGLSLTGAQAANYGIAASVSGATIGVITPATLTLTGAAAVGKVYDGTTVAVVDNAGASLNGLFGADVVMVTGPGAGVFATANVGARAVTLSGSYALSGADAHDYVLVQPTGFSAAITPATLTATIAGAGKTYDGSTAATLASGLYTLAGFVAGQGATVTKTTGVFDIADAGARTVSTALSAGDFTAAGGTLLSNYVLPTTAAGTGAITPRGLTGSIVGLPAKTYDGGAGATLTSSNFTLSGFVGGQGASVTQAAGTYAAADAGTRAVTAALAAGDFAAASGTSLANYVLPTSVSGLGLINARALTASITGGPSKVYDATTAATLTAGDYTLGGFVAGQGAVVTKAGGAYDAADAGSRTVFTSLSTGDFTAQGVTNLANYVLPTTATGAATITPRALTAALIGAPTKTYDGASGAALTSANFQLSGFVGSQGASVTRTSGTYDAADAGARTVSATLAAGDFFAGSGVNLANYTLPTTASGAGLILQKALTAAVTGVPTRAYDGTTAVTLSSADYTLSGFVAGQAAGVLQTAGVFSGADAGARGVTVTLGASDFGASAGTNLANYGLPVSATGTGAITPRALTATIVGAPTKTYDDTTAATLTASNYLLSGFVAGQGTAVTRTSGVYDAADAGARTVSTVLTAGDFTASGGTLLSNYQLPTAASGAGTIAPRAMTAVISGAPVKTYDGAAAATLGAGDFTLSGFVAGQGASVTQAAGIYASADAGTRAVTAALGAGDFVAAGGTNLANYLLPTAASGVGRIDPRALAVAIVGAPTKTYDATTGAALTAGDYLLTGFAAGQGAQITRATADYDAADAGARTIAASLSAADFAPASGTTLANYLLPTVATGAGVIAPRALTATITGDPTKTYDGATSASLGSANFTLAGFVAGQSATVTQASGAYDAADAGARIVTAALGAGDFASALGTNLANYALPTSAAGGGAITPRALTAALTGTPRKAYDGSTLATLTSADFTLSGFVDGQGATVTRTSGAYDGASAGGHGVVVSLAAGDFAARGGADLANYVLPITASGSGVIDRAQLAAAITGAPAKTYDGTTAAALTATDFTLTGFAAGEGAAVTQASGSYASADAGARAVTALLSAGDVLADGGTLLSNYILPTSAAGVGAITPRALTAAITGAPAKTYDGASTATLTPTDYALAGFVAGQGATVTQAAGVYDAADAGARTVSATLGGGAFVAAAGTNLANYVLPVAASGAGVVTPRALTAAISGDPTRMADGTTAAALTASNFVLSGFVTGQSASVTRTLGSYDAPDAGARTITASLGAGDFAAAAGTTLSNYLLPGQAQGSGRITPAVIFSAPTLAQSMAQNMTVRDLAPPDQIARSTELAAFAAATPRSYIPYPAPSALSTWKNNGFGSLPSILDPGADAGAATDGTVRSGPPVVNTTEQILLQGAKGKAWRIVPPTPPAATLSSLSSPPTVRLTAAR